MVQPYFEEASVLHQTKAVSRRTVWNNWRFSQEPLIQLQVSFPVALGPTNKGGTHIASKDGRSALIQNCPTVFWRTSAFNGPKSQWLDHISLCLLLNWPVKSLQLKETFMTEWKNHWHLWAFSPGQFVIFPSLVPIAIFLLVHMM